MTNYSADLERRVWKSEIGTLPHGWTTATLGELFDIQQGKALSPASRTGISPHPFLRTANVRWGRVDTTSVDKMDFDEEEVRFYALKPGDLLVCEGGDIGRTAMWNGEMNSCCYQNHLHRLRPKDNRAVPAFYMYWMDAAINLFGLYVGLGNKTTIPNLSKGRLASFVVPVPSKSEQRQIIQILSTIRHAQGESGKVLEVTRSLKDALMAKLLGNPSWPVVRLGDVTDLIMGQSPPSEFYNDVGEGLPFLQGKAEFQGRYPTPVKYCTQRLRIAPAGSVLISVRAPVGDVNIADQEYIIGRGLGSIRLKEGDNNLLFYLLAFAKPKVEALSSGTTFDSINKGVLQELEISLPPLREQESLSGVFSLVDDKIDLEQQTLHELTMLYNSVLNSLLHGTARLPDGGTD